jgi:hypothetical protein
MIPANVQKSAHKSIKDVLVRRENQGFQTGGGTGSPGWMRENFVATLWPGKGNLAFWAAGLIVATVAVMALRSCFSVEARERWRRMRSHGRVISRRRGPWVKLAVKTKKSKSDRGG